MKRRSWSFALCLVLQAHAAWSQQTGGRFGGSNWGAAPVAAPPPPMPPPPMPDPVVMPLPTPPPPAPEIAPTPTAPPPSMPPPQVAPPSPPTPRVRVTNYQRPPAREAPSTSHAEAHHVADAEYRLAHPDRDSNLRYGPPRTTGGLLGGGAFFALGAALTLWLSRENKTSARRMPSLRPPLPGVAPLAHPGVEVRRVSVAFDWTVRTTIQHALAQISVTVDTKTPPGLHAAAQATRDAIAGAHRAARYGTFQSWSLDPARGQQVFGQLADSLRARYTVETRDHARRVAAPKIAARREEGPGLVVVTLLVAARGPLPPLPPTMNLPALMAALAAFIPARPDLLAALEVVWSPAEDSDAMSSAELEVLYPELMRLDADAALGRRVCASCHAVYAGELGRCPACGAI